jgi:serine/threonine protein kinase
MDDTLKTKPVDKALHSTVSASAQTITDGDDNTSLTVSSVLEKTVKELSQKQNNINTDVFFLNGKEYKNVKCLSETSSEAQVFLVEKNGIKYVLKLYYPNYKAKHKVVKTILNFDFEMIMHVYDYGKIYLNGTHRDFELVEYLEGGTLNDYKLNNDFDQFRRIALQAAAALAYCHNALLIHKDIKPGNYFFRDEEHTQLVLGDFGISSLCKDDIDLENHHTSQARTPAYAAPEIYTDVIDGEVVISPASDYYSLGLTLFTLWVGRNPLSNNERVMMRQKSDGLLPHINELPERVRMIVQGLTAVNSHTRWTYLEVERWFKGENVKVDTSSPTLKYKNFIVDPEHNLVAENVYSLVPMLYDNQKLGMDYLYNHRISKWLSDCGNTKLNVAIDDIISHRYPADKKAGLMAALFTMDTNFPYYDIHQEPCGDIHSLALTLIRNSKEYSLQLKNPNDPLFVYIETHTNCDVQRLRSYFTDGKIESRIAILRTVYEIDAEIPFLANYPSSTVKEISHSFGECDCSEDDWQSLFDGRLLSWMYSHSNPAACESLRIFCEGRKYSKAVAYEALYNIDRESAFDLLDADTPKKIGSIFNEVLHTCQHSTDDEFREAIADYVDQDGRWMYYAQLHGWMKMCNETRSCFDLNSEENKERLGYYDIKTAAYRFCRILGEIPTYILPSGVTLLGNGSLSKRYLRDIRAEIRLGNLSKWLTVFYHEDPTNDFSEPYSYEHELEKYLMKLGEYDISFNFYKRFVDAKSNTEQMITDSHKHWNKLKKTVKLWRSTFITASIIWLLLFFVLGISNKTFFVEHIYWAVAMPVGICTMIMIAFRSYLRGYGILISLCFGLLGIVSAVLMTAILKWLYALSPMAMNTGIVIFTFGYVAIGMATGQSKTNDTDTDDMQAALENDDIKTSLLEPLYYTFKTKSTNYKGSKFGALEDITNQVTSATSSAVIHFRLWTAFLIVIIMEIMIYSPKALNVKNPDFGSLKNQYHQLIHQIKDTK